MEKRPVSGFVIQPRLPFENAKDKMLYHYLLDGANFVKSKTCGVGQVLTSISSLSVETGWSYGVVRGMLLRITEHGYISIKTMSQKRGIMITICDYEAFQNLEKYKKINKENNNPLTKDEQSTNKENNKENEFEKPCHKKENEGSESSPNKENNKALTKGEQSINKENRNTITAFITSLNIINNKTLKDYLAESSSKNMNLASKEEIMSFVDFALQVNALPPGASKLITVNYLDIIRLLRSTCKVSANLVAGHLEKLNKYTADQVNYAMLKHYTQHDDKKEQYTLGILRNTNIHEARRGLIKLKNKGGPEDAALLTGDEQKYEYGF